MGLLLHRGLSLGLALFGLIQASKAAPPGNLKRAVVGQYAAIVSASYEDSLAAARQLQQKIEALLATPSAPALEATRRAWLAARVPYLQTEACRFYDGPIDAVEGWINAWPIDEHYVDYVAGDPEAGVINEVKKFPRISRELIVSLNEREGEKNISTGFHAQSCTRAAVEGFAFNVGFHLTPSRHGADPAPFLLLAERQPRKQRRNGASSHDFCDVCDVKALPSLS